MTEKPALNNYPIHELIRDRWSPRAYSEQSVEKDKLLSLLENLILQATSFGLFAHQIGGFNVDKAKTEYQIPEDYEPATALTIGYPGDPQSLPDGLKERELAPRVRKSLDEFVFTEKWGKTSFLLKA